MAFIVSSRIKLEIRKNTIEITETYSGTGDTIVLVESDLDSLICTLEKVKDYIKKSK